MATLMHTQQPPQAQPVASSHPFTCNTCQVAFRSSDLQRTHMQSDWHRYNLKRRVASLPPLTSEIFAEKVLANKASAAATAARASFEKKCDACDKVYFSEGAYVNHLGSQKHRMLAARMARGGRGGDAATETDSMTGSTFSLGDPIEVESSSASTIHGEEEVAGEEFEEVVERLKQSRIAEGVPAAVSGNAPPRPTAPTPRTAQQQVDHPLSGKSSTKPEDAMEEDEEYEHKADVNQCLFCNYVSPTMDLNVNHMGRQHGFFVPEKEFLVDLPGLINYLSETIEILHQCLYCHKSVHTTSGVQTHMRDRGHCMMAYSTEDEQMDVGEYYDFRSTYEDGEVDDEEQRGDGGVSLGVKRAVKTTYQNEAGEDEEMVDDDEGWESDSSMSSVPTDEITSVPIEYRDHQHAKLDSHRHHSRTSSHPHKQNDGYHSHAHTTPTAVYHDDYELHLPSGRTAGHRSLRTYYRQNLRNYPTAEERAEQRMLEDGRHDSDADDEEPAASTEGRGRQLISRANGGQGMVHVSDAKKREVAAVEKRDQKRAQRAQKRYEWGNQKRANFQKHFRDPLLQ